MKQFKQNDFIGERALFRLEDALIDHCDFHDGESPLKEGRNLTVLNSTFEYKYPLWYGKNHIVKGCRFLKMARSGIWYTQDSAFEDCMIEAPKEFRRCKNITLKNITFLDAGETLWSCENVKATDLNAKGDYLFKDSKNLTIEQLELDGNYAFDGGENITISNSHLKTKDAFWNCKNVTVKDCVIDGEYFGWNSENITLIHCTISSHQGFCYMKNLTLKDCKILDSDLIFEYCENIDAEILSSLDSVKNPVSGIIKADSIKEIIRDDERIDLSKISVFVKNGNEYEKI